MKVLQNSSRQVDSPLGQSHKQLPGGGNDNLLQCSCQENSHGQKSLVGYSLWGCKELDTLEQLSIHTAQGLTLALGLVFPSSFPFSFVGFRKISFPSLPPLPALLTSVL